MPKPGSAMMYNAVWAVWSRIPNSPAATSVGVARVRRAQVARIDQTKMGIRLHVMPGAR